MAYPPHYLLQFGGPLGLSEEWSCSIRLHHPDDATRPNELRAAAAASELDDVVNDVRSWLTAMEGYRPSSQRLGYVKFNAITAAGTYASSSTTEVQYTTGQLPGQSPPAPFQNALAISWLTSAQRGLASRGRIFIPAAPWQVGDDGQFTAAAVGPVATMTRTFIQNLGNWPGFDLPSSPVPSVVSRGKLLGPKSWGPGLARPITRVAVGRVPDTQQRRRAKLREEHVLSEPI